ncbi:GNAT family N-acetyltransferase [soil metagenome]
MTDSSPLDHAIWFALTTAQQSMAHAHGLARRFPSDVSPLAALAEPTAQAFADLSGLVRPLENVALFTTAPVDFLDDWQPTRTRWIDQMICTRPIDAAGHPAPPLLRLAQSDVPEMLALATATAPGPFLNRTIDMGRYFGVRSEDHRLAAMAGERLRISEFTEISAVCTDPDFRGRGYSRALIALLVGKILAEGKTPFLHVKSENGAKLMYEKLGFTFRRAIRLTVIARR